jgi:hypothetical protein
MTGESIPGDVLISVEEGIARLARGEQVIVVDDEDRADLYFVDPGAVRRA